jgi:predicted ester cyclase
MVAKRIAAGLLMIAACGGSHKAEPAPEPPPAPAAAEPAPEPPPMTMVERIAFREQCFQRFLREDLGHYDDCYSETSSQEVIDGGRGPAVGAAAIRAADKPLLDGFTLGGETLMNLVSDELVVVLAALWGTHDGDFLGQPASGKKFGIYLARVEPLDQRGRPSQVALYFHPATILTQLGLSKGKVRPLVQQSGGEVPSIVSQDSEQEQSNVDLVQAGFDMINNRDWIGLTGSLARKAVWRAQDQPADITGHKKIVAQIKALTRAFSNGTFTVETIWGAGDWVVAEATFTGVNSGRLKAAGIQKGTKKSVTLHQLYLVRIEDDRFAEIWSLGNGAAMATQLGLADLSQVSPQRKELSASS